MTRNFHVGFIHTAIFMIVFFMACSVTDVCHATKAKGCCGSKKTAKIVANSSTPVRAVASAAAPVKSSNTQRETVMVTTTEKMAEQESENDVQKVIRDNDLVVVDYYGKYCGPCRTLLPRLEELARQNNKVVFVKLESEKAGFPEDITTVPTIKLFKNHSIFKTITGADIEKIKAAIADMMS